MQNQNQISGTVSLISEIHASTSAFLRARLKSKGMTDFSTSHGNILYRLAVHKRITMTELARSIHRDKSTTTVLVDKLERGGYVHRDPSRTDNRVTYLELTEKGNSFTDAMLDISAALTERCYRGFSDEEKEMAYKLLSRIAENFSNEY